MADIFFEGDSRPVRENFRNPNSKLTQLFIDKSFGFIKTPKQAMIAQLILIVILALFSTSMFAKSVPKPPSAPSIEQINAPMPTKPAIH